MKREQRLPTGRLQPLHLCRVILAAHHHQQVELLVLEGKCPKVQQPQQYLLHRRVQFLSTGTHRGVGVDEDLT